MSLGPVQHVEAIALIKRFAERVLEMTDAPSESEYRAAIEALNDREVAMVALAWCEHNAPSQEDYVAALASLRDKSGDMHEAYPEDRPVDELDASVGRPSYGA